MSTIRDVARIAGVSISTVSLALNQRHRVSEKTFRNVMEAAKEAGYSANPIAQSLKFGRSPIISMIVSDIRYSFWESFLRGVEADAYRNGFMVSLSNTASNPENLKIAVEHVVGQRVAGIILSATQMTTELIDTLRQSRIPVLLVDHKIEAFASDFVALDNQLAIGILTRHLIGHGHRDIGFVAGRAGQWSADERRRAFVETMATNDLTVDEARIVDGRWNRTGGYDAAMRLLVGATRPTGIIASNDEMMIGVLQACQELGYTCGEDVSVCCVDGMPWGDVLRPRITHVVQPVDQMSVKAASWIYERVQNRTDEIAPREMLFAPQLVLGDSVAKIA